MIPRYSRPNPECMDEIANNAISTDASSQIDIQPKACPLKNKLYSIKIKTAVGTVDDAEK